MFHTSYCISKVILINGLRNEFALLLIGALWLAQKKFRANLTKKTNSVRTLNSASNGGRWSSAPYNFLIMFDCFFFSPRSGFRPNSENHISYPRDVWYQSVSLPTGAKTDGLSTRPTKITYYTKARCYLKPGHQPAGVNCFGGLYLAKFINI